MFFIGQPLASKTIGSLLRFKKTREEWQHILESGIWKIEEFEKGLLPPLLLSYNDLPSIIKRCFTYYAIFSKDYNIKKHQLIKLWMTQGFLESKQNIEMEIIGQSYFDHLATRSFFQKFENYGDDNVINCKMHDIVHDFAQLISHNECFTVEINGVADPFANSSHEEIHHSMLKLNHDASFPISICRVKRLCSLLITWRDFCYLKHNDLLPMVCDELTCLRVLSLNTHEYIIKEIPKAIEKLIHLRYLDLSHLNMEKIPETLCELYNLQTLDLTCCIHLKELPQGRLINLRHFINHRTNSLSYMPTGFDKLTCLRTLNEFIVSGSVDHDNKACTLECLKDLNYLRGDLMIRGLGHVVNVNEAKRTDLTNKKNLFKLDLTFVKDGEEERMNEDDELLLEALQPPANL